MRERGDGILVGIASVAGFRGLPGAGAYSASKAAAINWLESLRVEFAGSGVAVVTICPGYVETPMTRVNPYRMPFLLGADDAVRRIARAIDSRRSFIVIPWQMAIVGRAMRLLPNALYGAIAAAAPGASPGTCRSNRSASTRSAPRTRAPAAAPASSRSSRASPSSSASSASPGISSAAPASASTRARR